MGGRPLMVPDCATARTRAQSSFACSVTAGYTDRLSALTAVKHLAGTMGRMDLGGAQHVSKQWALAGRQGGTG